MGAEPTVAFVVLHYLAADLTVAAVDKVLGLRGAWRLGVVIVDNASPDGSGEQLRQRYEDNEQVHVLLEAENLGFARGNNAGYAHALLWLDPAFVVIMNNDVFVIQPDFVERVARIFDRTDFAVLGPDVWAPALGVHQSPRRMAPMGADEALAEAERLRGLAEFGLRQRLRVRLKQSSLAMKFVMKLRKRRGGVPWDEEREGVVIHGSCFVVSRKFIKARPDALNPRTYMYYEMEILDHECRAQGLPVVYSPEVRVEHRHSVSTGVAMPDAIERQRFIYRHMIDSLQVLAEIADGGE